ncbi:histidine N-alpha-methyltransferase [Podospora aff. communis PSN243]|uniref:4-dimethylallyltryptophan N-methyltransferase n=1 Tax=Podospora aff. communis PSN243 TaxID=3040156 RepID=A0AAV9GLG5_9PEZI|nr:histidine N-alpha-methyltransferase [Podospora aff. communis PSN243]
MESPPDSVPGSPKLEEVNDLVIDIGGSRLRETLHGMLMSRLLDPTKQCLLPSALLSDDQGSSLWREINRLPAYYQTSEEILLLELYGDEIADLIEPCSVLVDLGCGETRKVRPLLDSLERSAKRVDYYGLDLSLPSLQADIRSLASEFTFVRCRGLWGTFDDAQRWVAECVKGPIWLLSLGSILGNDFPEPAVAHLARWASLMNDNDRMLVGMDATTDKQRIWDSYHDSSGLFEQFMRGGCEHSNRVLGHNWYRPQDWEVVGVWAEQYCMHRFVFRALVDVQCAPIGLDFRAGHEIDCYEAFKFGPAEMRALFEAAGLRQQSVFKAPGTSAICKISPVQVDTLREIC